MVTTSLGTQTIGGVTAEGTRYTRTIPAGQIGNVKPIVIVTERWYSADLQMVVMTKRSDPRSGDTVFQMTSIARTEPAATFVPGAGGLHGDAEPRRAVRGGGPGAPPTTACGRVSGTCSSLHGPSSSASTCGRKISPTLRPQSLLFDALAASVIVRARFTYPVNACVTISRRAAVRESRALSKDSTGAARVQAMAQPFLPAEMGSESHGARRRGSRSATEEPTAARAR